MRTIGITATIRPVHLPVGPVPAQTVLDAYVEHVAAAGGAPVLLPVVDPSLAEVLVVAVDALVLTGGADLGVDPDLDASETALVHAALAAGRPILGVCRGLQVLTAATGGTLVAHVDGHLDVRHPVAVRPGTILAGALGTTVDVRSLHHQAVAVPGRGFRVAATAPDGTVEAVEAADGRPVVGVQWHPELDGGPLWTWLVGAAGARS